jgi:tetratricopeptide (TPR) repeat protein
MNRKRDRGPICASRRVSRARALGALGVVFGTAWTLSSRAEASDSVVAQALFDDGKRLMAAGNVVEACPKFEESQRRDPGTGTLLNLAACYEQSGRLASAWSTYLAAAFSAHAAGDAAREALARDGAQALEPRLSKLVIRVA